mgnify:CR=1 FL=1
MLPTASRVLSHIWCALLNRDLSPATWRALSLGLVWLLLLFGGLWTVHRAPEWLEPRQVRIELPLGHSVILGHNRAQRRDDLWSPDAEAEHIRLLRTPAGDWRLENVAAHKKVLWTPHGAEEDRWVREWPLAPGGQFSVGEHPFTVVTVTPSGLTLQSADQTWRYDGISLTQQGQPLPPCEASGFEALLSLLPAWLRDSRPLRLGGGVQCATRLGLRGVMPDQALIVPTATGYALRPGPTASPDASPVMVNDATQGRIPLQTLTVPLAAGDQLIIGHTHYRVTQTVGALILTVTAHGQRWPAHAPRPDALPVVQATLTPFVFHGPNGPMLLALIAPWSLGLLALLLPWIPGWFWVRSRWQSRWRSKPAWPVWPSLLLCGSLASGALASFFWGENETIGWPYALAWLALGGLSWVAAQRTAWSALLVGLLTGLLGWGLIAQLQLGLGADEPSWLRYGAKTAALTGTLGGLLLAGWCFWRGFRPNWLESRWVRWVIPALAGLSLIALGYQMVAGDEGGLGFIQPVELVKVVLVAATAAALAQRFGLHGWDYTLSKAAIWWRYLWPILLVVGLVLFALAFLHDFSPVVLLVVGALVLTWAYVRIHPDRLWRQGGQGALVVGLGVLVWAIVQLHQHPERFPAGLQSDRIQVWATPERYPHAGYQLRQALTAIRTGGWWGVQAGSLPGHADPGRNGRVMAVPAVQDDFAPAFFLHRYGGVSGLILLAAQLLLVLTLLRIGVRALDWTQENNYRLQTLGGFAYFALFGSAGLLAAHFLVSWGTNLGFLPVMGQPMPLLSAAGSHLLLFVGPTIAFALALEEQRPDGC